MMTRVCLYLLVEYWMGAHNFNLYYERMNANFLGVTAP